jgi:uncharacterized protein (DUF1697 family)
MIKMAHLKALYESIGFTGVTTHLQSGNVIFGWNGKDPSSVGKLIGEAIEKSFGFPVTVIIRPASALGRIIDACPFIGRHGIDKSKLHITFLRSKPGAALVKALGPLAAKSTDEYKLLGSEIYLHCPNGYGKTLLSNTFFERQLKVPATTRNWKTVNSLCAMSGGMNE